MHLRSENSIVDKSQVLVFLGLKNRSAMNEAEVQMRMVTKITIHPRYNLENLSNDVAILTLSDRVQITEFVDIVYMAQRSAPAQTPCYVTGFGIKDSQTRNASV